MAFFDSIIDPGDVEGQGDPYLNDYEVDEALIKRQNLRYIGTDNKGNRMWKGTGGSIYYARDLAKTNYGTSDNQDYDGGQSDDSDNGSHKRRNDDTSDNVTDTTPTTDSTEVLSSGRPAWMPENQGYSAPKRKPTSNNVPAPKPAKRVWNDDSVLSSAAEVTKKPVLNNEGEEETPTIKTYFIEQRGGKFLGESKAYYKYVRENRIQEKLVTFPELSINLRSIPNYKERDGLVPGDGNHLDFDRGIFTNISDAITFNKKEIKKAFQEIVDKTKLQYKDIIQQCEKKATQKDKYDTFADLVNKDFIKEQALAMYYDYPNNVLSAVMLPDDFNKHDETKVFRTCIYVVSQTGSYLFSFDEKLDDKWKIARELQSTLDNEDKNGDKYKNAERDKIDMYYVSARRQRKMVVGVAHTHPAIFNNPYRSINDKTFSAKVSDDDYYRAIQSDKLPDMILTFKNDTKDVYFTDINYIEVLTIKSGIESVAVVAHTLDELLMKLEKNIFEFVISKYVEYE